MSKLAGADDELEPPWAKYPQIMCGSIGWRMGYGEDYQMEWGSFVETRCPDVEAAVRYLKGHPPAGRTWTGWIAGWLVDLGADEERAAAIVEREGLVGDDAAYPVYLRNAEREGGMVAPWETANRDPRSALRYYTRELGWWGRWFAGEPDRASWLASRPAAPASWAAIASQIAAGTCDASWATLDGDADRLIPLLAARGELTPPWVGGHAPKPEVEWDLAAADDRDRWSWWAFDMFEDARTFGSYLDRHAAPPAWRGLLAANLDL